MWVKFFVGSSKSRAEEYFWYGDARDAGLWSDEDLRSEAEDWASGTSQGRLNDSYRYGFERVSDDKLPPEVLSAKIEEYERIHKHAGEMLEMLRKKAS